MTHKPAAEISVSKYHQILFWPLLLKEPEPPTTGGAQFEKWREALERGGWATAPTLPREVTAEHDPDVTYEEIVYFHPFVRDFLYGDGSDDPERPLVRLRREDVKTCTAQFVAGGPILELTVKRLELYLCKPLVALVVVEVVKPMWAGGRPFTLADALTVQHRLRQVYPPFFNELGAGNCAQRITFHCSGGDLTSDFAGGRACFAAFAHRGAEPPVAAHWKGLLAPLEPYPGNLGGTGRYYQQIEDDRMPGMTFLAVGDPREVSDGDYDRLAWCDEAGPDPTPYAPDFLAAGRVRYTYDRFWEPDRTARGGYDTRHLCSGYHYTTVVRAGYEFAETVLLDHFRRHYFRIGLILHYHRAALLKFQDEMAEAIKLLHRQSPDEEWGNVAFRRRVTFLQMTFLKFRTRAWFTEVSNQLQGRELFTWWGGLLGTEALFQQVDDASQRLYSGLAEYETRELARSQERLARSQERLAASQKRLAVVALLGVPASVVLAGMALLLTGFQVKWNEIDGVWAASGVLVGAVALSALLAYGLFQPGVIDEFDARLSGEAEPTPCGCADRKSG